MAWTDPRTWVTDELVTAALMNTHIRDNLNAVPHLLAVKTADESVISSTTLQDDDHLFFSVGANEVWWFEGWLMCDGPIQDIKFAFTAPAGATMRWGFTGAGDSSVPSWLSVLVSGSPAGLAATGTAIVAALAGAGTVVGVGIAGILAVAGTAGTARLQWAQNSSVATNTTVKQNSFLMGMKIN